MEALEGVAGKYLNPQIKSPQLMCCTRDKLPFSSARHRGMPRDKNEDMALS